MSKAILVLDEMPEVCLRCPLSIYNNGIRCVATNGRSRPVDDYNTKPDWCPLKALPDKKSE